MTEDGDKGRDMLRVGQLLIQVSPRHRHLNEKGIGTI